MRYFGVALFSVVLVGGCSGVPLTASLTSPESVSFRPGVGADSFELLQDGPDDDLGVLDLYVSGLDDATATKLGYRRQNLALGGRIYIFVVRDGVKCTADIAKPTTNNVTFDNECGRGEINVPTL